MVKKIKKVEKIKKDFVVYEANFDWKKIIKLSSMALISALITFFIVINIPKMIKYIAKLKTTKSVNKEKRKIEFSTDANLSYFDPAYLIKDIAENNLNYVLVDTRSAEEYKLGHIKSAVNVPLYSNFSQIEKSKVKLSEFKTNIVKNNKKNKTAILYGYFSKSQILIDGAVYLQNAGIKIQLLSVSWYEFKNNPYMWLPGNDLGVTEINKYLEGSMYENK